MSQPSIPRPQYTLMESVNVAIAVAKRALEEVRALSRVPGAEGPQGKQGPAGVGRDGERGPEGREGKQGPAGPVGSIYAVEQWSDSIHYQGVVRTFDGATYQAKRDTGKQPPHEDWICIAAAGRNGDDGRSFEVCGTFNPARQYQRLSVVALNGASFAAKCDNPGACPGEGWQLIASQGKRGDKGERGERGLQGVKGDAGPAVVRMAINRDGLLTLVNGDGSTVDLDLYPVLSRVL